MRLTSRTNFNESWLSEMPERIESTDLIDMIKYTIQDLQNNNQSPTQVSPNLKKIELSSVVYYWQEDAKGNIIIGGEFGKTPQALVVHAVGKQGNKGQPPWASDLYLAVLADQSKTQKSIRLSSDSTMTDEGVNIWKRLLKAGHPISVYDKTSPGQTHTRINSPEEMDQFIQADTNFRKYQFVVSESISESLEVRSYFLTRRTRELAGML